MIRPQGLRAAAFALAADGDGRADPVARDSLSARLGTPAAWATIDQVHGGTTVVATAAGPQGRADALVTAVPDLPVVVATADCLPIVIEGRATVAVVHAGWRGLAAGIIESAIEAMLGHGDELVAAAIGPCIGPCCYEVGEEVADRFAHFQATTTWGTPSVDLRAAAAARLEPLPVWVSGRCTRTDPWLYSHREDGTAGRQVTVAWVPTG
jgi:polyphenol oxidase